MNAAERSFQVTTEEFFFAEPNSGYYVVRCKVKSHPDEKKVGNEVVCEFKGHDIKVGATYEVTGFPKYKEKYNRWQLAVKEYQQIGSLSKTGIIEYLVREGPNVGRKRAEQIVEAFGEDALSVIQDEPSRLVSRIEGLTLSRAEELSSWAASEKENSSVKKMLYSLKLTPGLVSKLIHHLGNDASRKIKKDCFKLTSIDGIGFLTVCKIADRLGIPETRPDRIRAGVVYTVKSLCEQKGHTCIPHDILVNESCKILGVHKKFVIREIKKMMEEDRICTQKSDPKKFSKNPEIFEQKESNIE